jgi:16S rRNA U516 pseudouridylate synthase RsuA-like enzyme
VRIGNIELSNIKEGSFKKIDQKEINELQKFIGIE